MCVDDNHAVRRLRATALGILLALCNVGVAESGKLLLAVNPHHSVVGGFGQNVAPLLLKLGDARVDLLHAVHVVGREQGARAHKALVNLLGKALVLALKLGVLVVVDVLDTGK